MYVEDLRQEKIRQSTELLRELEYAHNPTKLKLLFRYKSKERADYEQEQRSLKLEYRSSIMDPGREAARVETKRVRMKTKVTDVV